MDKKLLLFISIFSSLRTDNTPAHASDTGVRFSNNSFQIIDAFFHHCKSKMLKHQYWLLLIICN